MSYRKCISNGITEGSIKDHLGKEQLELLENLERRYIGEGMNPTEASKAAAKKAYEELKHQSIIKKRNLLLQLKAQKQAIFDMEQYRTPSGEKDFGEALVNMTDFDARSGILNLTNLKKEEHGRILRPITELIEKFRARTAGRKTNEVKATMPLLVKEYFNPGSTSSKTAKEFAVALKEALETARLRYNKFGGDIRKLSYDWLPQNHSRNLVGRVSFEEWSKDILEAIDMNKMVNNRTGLPFTKGELELILPGIWRDISTDGLASKVASSQYRGSSALMNKRMDHRFFHFKDGDAYNKYMTKYSEGDVFSNVIMHIESIARDIAIMRKFGPNQNAGKQYIIDYATIKNEGLTNAKIKNKFQGKVKTFDNLFEYHKGVLFSAPDNFAARFLAGTRQILVSALLGSASIIAQTDFFFSSYTSRFAGLPQSKTAGRTLKIMFEGFKKEKTQQKVAMRLGFVAESFLAINYAATRYSLDIDAPAIAKMFSDFTLRWSGLSNLTQSGRLSFGLEFLGFLGDNVNKRFIELPKKFQSTMKRYGINEGDWDIIRKTELRDAALDDDTLTPGQNIFFDPDNILKRTDLSEDYKINTTSKIHNMILTETEHAIPSSSARGRVAVTGGTRPGTLIGEVGLSALMFKNFPITMLFTHIKRGLTEQGLRGKLGYLVPFIIGTTLVAAVAHEQREMLKGRKFANLETLKDPKYWWARMIQGGGLAIFGDLIYQETNSQYNTGAKDALLGPGIGFGIETFNLLVEAGKAIAQQDNKLGASTSRFIRKYSPGNSIFWFRAAFERIIVDTLENMINPNFHRKNRNIINRYQKNEFRDYWWYPGETLPSSAPGISE